MHAEVGEGGQDGPLSGVAFVLQVQPVFPAFKQVGESTATMARSEGSTTKTHIKYAFRLDSSMNA